MTKESVVVGTVYQCNITPFIIHNRCKTIIKCESNRKKQY